MVGERPSAEEFGDDGHKARGTNTWASIRPHKQPGCTELQGALDVGARVILVILSGRPLVIEDPTLLERCRAILEADCPVR
ncbi:MAG: hypothetical protein JW751_01910 [Polyangiaceae bacterium]|nr:hypothetical protein [Polyangiaceae bacterium]